MERWASVFWDLNVRTRVCKKGVREEEGETWNFSHSFPVSFALSSLSLPLLSSPIPCTDPSNKKPFPFTTATVLSNHRNLGDIWFVKLFSLSLSFQNSIKGSQNVRNSNSRREEEQQQGTQNTYACPSAWLIIVFLSPPALILRRLNGLYFRRSLLSSTAFMMIMMTMTIMLMMWCGEKGSVFYSLLLSLCFSLTVSEPFERDSLSLDCASLALSFLLIFLSPDLQTRVVRMTVRRGGGEWLHSSLSNGKKILLFVHR